MRERSPWLYGGIGFGFGYLWGGWWPHPPLIIITPPPPGEIWPPEEVPPVAVPLPEDPSFTEWASENPDLAEPYLGEVDTPAAPLLDEQLPAEPGPDMAVQPVEREPAISIEPAPVAEPMDLPGTMDTPMDMPMDAPMDMPMDMPMDIPMDLGDF